MTKQRILFITTGGTIASVRTQQGLKPVLNQRGAACPSAGIERTVLPENAGAVQH